MRITVIGHAGSGKSTLAAALSKKVGVPHIQLDRLWFEAGGHALRKDDAAGKERVRTFIRERVEEAIRQDAWVSDGWYPRVQPMIAERADLVVFLDVPLWRRLLNHIRRAVVERGRRHAEVTHWDDVTFLWRIVRRTWTQDDAMRAFVRDRASKAVVLRTRVEMDAFRRQFLKEKE